MLNGKKFSTLMKTKKQWEKKLAQLKENIKYSQQLAKTGSWTYDMQTGKVFWTEEIYNLLDCNYNDLNEKLESFLPYVHPADLEKVKKANQDILEGREFDIEYRITTPKGAVKYLHEKTKVLYNENNEPIRSIGIIRDITNQKLIEKNLRELGEDSKQALKVSGVGSWKYDILKDEFSGTQEMFQIYGIDSQDFKGDFNSTLKLIHPEDQSKIQEALEKHLRGETCEYEFRILQPDGREKHVLAKGEPIFDQDGQVISVLGTLQDITKNKILELELRKSYKILAQAQALASLGSWEMDLADCRIHWSEEAYKIFGITPGQWDNTYQDFLKLVHPDDVTKFETLLENPPQKPCELEFRIIRPDGSIRNIFELVEFIFTEDGQPVFVYGTIQDVTEKIKLKQAVKRKQEEINLMQKRFEALVQKSTDVFEIIAPDGTIKYISDASEKIIGYKPEERIGRKIYEYYEGKELEKITGMVNFVLNESREIQSDIVFTTKKGSKVVLEVHMQNLLTEPAVEGIVVNFRDITKRVEMTKEISYLATHDQLTGLPNRNVLNKNLEAMCQESPEQAPFALMILDIDSFNYINYALGYSLSDQLIIEVAKRLNSHFGEEELVFHFSGDQFALIVQSLSKLEEYMGFAQKVIQLLSQPFKVDNYELHITVSIGISIYPRDGKDWEQLIKYAHIALLRAKNEGKNKYKFYSPDIDIHSYKQFELHNDLPKAIENGELNLYYQPIVNLKNNQILGAEALVSWEHPSWGTVAARQFTALAEETGLIVTIGKWLLREVCKTYKQWLKDKLPKIKVSISISKSQFFEKDFVENVKGIIAEFGLEPDFLIMEISGKNLPETDKIASDLQKLQALGIEIALVEFGTTCLASLNSLKIDYLKINRAISKNILTDPTHAVTTKYLIKTAQELEIKFIAEGIETSEQLAYLQRLKCLLGQGAIYSRPLPAKDFEKILAKKKCKPQVYVDVEEAFYEEKREFFRIKFHSLLEAEMTILKLKGRNVNVGNTKVLIENIGPGGLCFISNIKLPVEKYLILQFTTQLLDTEIKVTGYPVWLKELDDELYKYGIEYVIDENERIDLVKIFNQVQIKMKHDILFAEGSFVSSSPAAYFNSLNRKCI